MAAVAALAVACGRGDPAPTPEPVATEATEARATATPPPEPTPTATPEATATATATAEPTPAATPAPTPAAAPAPASLSSDDLTRAFVAGAIEYYEEHGRDATVEFYRSEAGIESGRALVLVDTTEHVLLVYRAIPALQGQYVGPGSSFSSFAALAEVATEDGSWTVIRGINPDTKQEEPRRVLLVLHDGLVFGPAIRRWWKTLRNPSRSTWTGP